MMEQPRAEPDDDFQLLVDVLPEPLKALVRELPPAEILEVVMDLGRAPQARLVNARVVGRLESADLILTLRSRANDPKMRRTVERTGARVEVVKRNSSAELRRVLRGAFMLVEGVDEEQVREAVAEAEHAIQRVLSEGVVAPLAPRPPRLRKLQHQLVSRYHLETVSLGSEPVRHLVIYPLGAEVEAALQESEAEGTA